MLLTKLNYQSIFNVLGNLYFLFQINIAQTILLGKNATHWISTA